MSPVGDITSIGFASRTSGAFPTWRECAENHAVFQCCQERARSKSLPKEWLGSSDRAYQRLSTCVEKSRHARCFRACAPENRFVGCCWKLLKFHSTTASSLTAHRHRPVELGAADRSKPNLTKWQNKIPTRVSFLCASARNVRRSAAAAPRCRGRYVAVEVVR